MYTSDKVKNKVSVLKTLPRVRFWDVYAPAVSPNPTTKHGEEVYWAQEFSTRLCATTLARVCPCHVYLGRGSPKLYVRAANTSTIQRHGTRPSCRRDGKSESLSFAIPPSPGTCPPGTDVSFLRLFYGFSYLDNTITVKTERDFRIRHQTL